MNGLEIAYIRADLLSRELMMNTDISTQFIVAPLMDAQKREGEVFEFIVWNIIAPTIGIFASACGKR